MAQPAMTEPDQGDGLDAGRVKVLLAVVMLGTFVAPLDSSIVNIALPTIARELHARISDVGWVATAYLLTNATLVLTMGRLGDVWGLRKVYVLGFSLFGVGSLACALSPELAWLIASRVLQAVGASMVFASGPAIVSGAVPPARRGYALGLVGLAVSAGLTAGPPLGGLLVGLFGWPSIFLVNVPIVVVTVLIAWRVLPDDRPAREPFDIAGALLGGGSLLALLLALGQVEDAGWSAPIVLGLAAVAVVLGSAFVAAERRHPHPMLDLSLFRSWAFAAGTATAVLAYLALFTMAFLMPFYLLRVQGIRPEVAGLLMTAPPLSMALFAPVAGRLSDRWGSRGLTTTGMALSAVGLALLSMLGVDTPLLAVAGALLLLGSGMAVFQAPNTSAILGATPRHRLGVGSAITSQARNVGMVLGIGVTAAIVSAGLAGTPLLEQTAAFTPAERLLFLEAMRPALRFGAAIAAVGSVVSFARPAGRPNE